MHGEQLLHALPKTAASDINPRSAVVADVNLTRAVISAATNNLEPAGVVGPATALRTEAVTVYGPNSVIEVTAAASLGPGADVGVASGGFSPVAGASGVTRYRVGKSEEGAAAGERFSLYINPKQLSNLI